jgi:tRNA pseudouridine38-40 synthase
MELQYDGTGLYGWAKQEGLPTVEGSLEAAFGTVLGSVPKLYVAGRTDTGVHARRQVVSLRLPVGTDLPRLTYSLNALTPPGIAITRIRRAPEGFDARKHATSRTYRYYLSASPVVSPFWGRYSWEVAGKIDLALLRGAATAAVGRHDFTAFTPSQTKHAFFNRLVMRCSWKQAREGLAGGDTARGRFGGGTGLIYLEIEADAFLRHMVRALVGTMVEVAQQKRTPADFGRLLEGAPREVAGLTAPAHGLFLWDVRYDRGRR